MPSTVLILGSADDEHAAHVAAELSTRGVPVEFLRASDFPQSLQIAYDPCHRTGTFVLPGGQRLAFDEVRSVYWRCYDWTAAPPLPDAEQAMIAQNDARSLFESVLIQLPARWVNGYRAYQLHQTKPVQLAMVAALGVPVPATLLSNDAESLCRFVAEHGRCIFKPVQGGAHTRPVTEQHLTPENLASLRCAPVTIQEEVPGTDVRVFVAGQRLLACEIHTAALDFRDDPDPRITPLQLPADVAAQCLAVAERLDLLWTGIDLRRTPEGKFVFLEANPSPMFLGFEQRSGLPLTEGLLDVLTTPAP